MAPSKRIVYLDLLKAFTIFMVLMGHCIQHLSIVEGQEYYDKIGYRIIYSFHMPLFMAICGYFSWRSNELGVKDFFIRKFKQLLLPAFIFFSVDYLITRSGSFVSSAYYCFWFLKSAFICYVIFYLATKLNRSCSGLPIGYILSLMATQLTGVFNINLMYPCFLLGAMLSKFDEKLSVGKYIIGSISGLVFLLMLVFFDSSYWNYNHIYMRRIIPMEFLILPDFWAKHLYKLTIGIVGTVFFIYLFKILFANIREDSKTVTLLSKVGRMTLGIYILQTFILERYLPEYLHFVNTPPLFSTQFIAR